MRSKLFTHFTLAFSIYLIGTVTVTSKIQGHGYGYSGRQTPTVVPVAELREARQFLGSTQKYTTEFPHWVNRTLLRIGQSFLVHNFYGYLYGMGLTTLLVGASTDARRIVISTGNTTEVHKASKRYLINVLHFWYWATADLKRSNGKDNDELFEVLNLIHAVHTKVGLAAHRRPHLYEKPLIPNPPRGENPHNLETKLWNAFERDLMASHWRTFASTKPIFPPRNGGTDYYLNQFAMTAQLWAFAAFPILTPERVLIYGARDEQLLGYLHFWAFVGHAVGIDDRFNVCLQADLDTTREYFRDMLAEYFVPALLDLDYESKAVMEVGIKAMAPYFKFVNVGVALYRLCKDVLAIECPQLWAAMPATDRLYNSIVERVGHPFSEFNSTKSAINFVINGLIQSPALKEFNVNNLDGGNLTEALLQLDQQILRTSNVYWNDNDNDNSMTMETSITLNQDTRIMNESKYQRFIETIHVGNQTKPVLSLY